jgi:ABC-type Na+ transport system ATPase subunit NatA
MHEGRKVLAGSLADLQRQTGKNDLVEMFVDLLNKKIEPANA